MLMQKEASSSSCWKGRISWSEWHFLYCTCMAKSKSGLAAEQRHTSQISLCYDWCINWAKNLKVFLCFRDAEDTSFGVRLFLLIGTAVASALCNSNSSVPNFQVTELESWIYHPAYASGFLPTQRHCFSTRGSEQAKCTARWRWAFGVQSSEKLVT